MRHGSDAQARAQRSCARYGEGNWLQVLHTTREGAGLNPLDHATMHAKRCHVIGHVQEPDSFPGIQHRPKVLSGENQLSSTTSGVTRVDRQEATGGCAQCGTNQSNVEKATHVSVLRDR